MKKQWVKGIEQAKEIWEEFPIQKKQRILAGASITGMIALMGVAVSALYGSKETPLLKKEALNLETAADVFDPQKAWRQQMEVEQKVLQEKIDTLMRLVEGQGKNSSLDEQVKEIQQQIKGMQDTNLKEADTYIREKGEGTLMEPPPEASKLTPSSFSNFSQDSSSSFPSASSGSPTPLPLGVVKLVMNKNDKQTQRKKSVDTFIPAGTFAKAVILGGVDASTSIQASSDPRPVLLRLVDKGTLPRNFRSDLKHCHVLASAYGDISSERVMMRLEKMSCVEELTGEVTEMTVSGYISGEDGRAGVRGIMVDKAGAQIRFAFVGGLFGGLSEYLTQTLKSGGTSVTPFGHVSQFDPLSKGELLKSSVGKGVNNAFDKITDFYIKRAEQLQPIIQIAAGRVVDIVITQGTLMGESEVRQAVVGVRDHARDITIQSVQQHIKPEDIPGNQQKED